MTQIYFAHGGVAKQVPADSGNWLLWSDEDDWWRSEPAERLVRSKLTEDDAAELILRLQEEVEDE